MYFNLNDQTEIAIARANDNRPGLPSLAESPTQPERMSMLDQLSMFGAVALGVIAKPSIDFFRGIGARPEWTTDPFLIIGFLLLALVILPLIYRTVAIDPQSPWIMRFALFFQAGFFYPAFLQAVLATPPTP